MPGHFAGTFIGHIYVWLNVHSSCILVLLVLLCCVQVRLHRQTPRGIPCATSVFSDPSALWAGFCRCVFVHRLNLRESTTAIPLGITSDVRIPTQQDDKQRQREPSRRLQGRAPTDYTTMKLHGSHKINLFASLRPLAGR